MPGQSRKLHNDVDVDLDATMGLVACVALVSDTQLSLHLRPRRCYAQLQILHYLTFFNSLAI